METASTVFFAINQFNNSVVKRLDANLSVHGISFSEFQVLHQLAASPQQTLPRIELARLVGLSASGVTRMLAPMEKIGLVEKESHPRDARMSLVKLARSGASIHSDAAVTVEHVVAGFLEGLTATQQKALAQLS